MCITGPGVAILIISTPRTTGSSLSDQDEGARTFILSSLSLWTESCTVGGALVTVQHGTGPVQQAAQAG